MTDDDLRARVRAAHRDDAPPPFATVLARARRGPRRRRWIARAALAALGAAAALFGGAPRRPPPAPALAEIDLRWSTPLDFLLEVPGDDLLRATPRFDMKGTLP